MNKSASSGPDGFGPGFYRKFWYIVKPKINSLFQQFFDQTAGTTSINRSHLILLQKMNQQEPLRRSTLSRYKIARLKQCQKF
jgi:hypothetical protein